MGWKGIRHATRENVGEGLALGRELANLLWYAFLVLVAIATFLTTGRVFDDVFVDVLKFLFILMGGGFTLATFLDILYERVYVSKDAGERP